MEDNVESFLSQDDGDPRDIFAALKGSPADQNPGSLKGKYGTDVCLIIFIR